MSGGASDQGTRSSVREEGERKSKKVLTVPETGKARGINKY